MLASQLMGMSGIGPQTVMNQNQPVQNSTLPQGSVMVVPINIDDTTVRSSPSQKAIDAARNIARTKSINTGSPSPSNPSGSDDGTNAATIAANNAALRTTLFSYIIDCWVTLTSVPTSVANSTST